MLVENEEMLIRIKLKGGGVAGQVVDVSSELPASL